ncbi:aspartate aminotransferase [Penicillium nucicola]|uniref:aspartate aminotransferase n=1 Tax=Penicillium nucicola TaxID=1850975 RepID=UPI0025456272|nr:aspartate aminotransferase [Penicillium nucicola]KAJ5747449.1 aspartate aminotransferase [Penicillium nucicola]
MAFKDIQKGPVDIMYHIKVMADADKSPKSVDLGVGVYRNQNGEYNELEVLKKFLENAAQVIFGQSAPVLGDKKVASVQTISGTGSIHIALMFLKHCLPDKKRHVYIGTPTWGNYEPMCRLVGLESMTYNYYNSASGQVDFESVLDAIRTSEPGSVFILQACCHSPTAADFSKEQWHILAKELVEHDILPLFDIAYQGMGKGIDEDAYGIRYFAEQGFEMFVCQSFSKNFGLYGERTGALHVVCASEHEVAPVHDQLRCLIRWEFSSSPAYGSRLVNLVLSDPAQELSWRNELASIRSRLQSLRKEFRHLLVDVYKIPGNWSVIESGSGLFSFLPLTPVQCKALQEQHHIYMVPNGRITISGLTETNIEYVVQCIAKVVIGQQ